MIPAGRRGGFTLVELLVATGVFIIGFVAVYTLFLSGMRFRKLSDDITKTSTLASTLLTEVYIDSPYSTTATAPAKPTDYDGCGDPRYVETATPAPATAPKVPQVPLYAYQGIPGTVYRLSNTQDITQTNDPMATALVTTVLALCPGGLPPANAQSGQTLASPVATYQDLENRSHLMLKDSGYQALSGVLPQAQYYENALVQHGIAMSYTAVIIRQPHWLYAQP